MYAYFVSDIHLKTLNEKNSHLFLDFLFRLRDQPVTHLFLLGDIFDMWVGDHSYYYEKFKPIVDSILYLKKLGVQIFYFEGNHDLHVKRFWEDRLQIHTFCEPLTLTIEGVRLRLEHGDYINPEDKAYLKYREFIRKPMMKQIAHMLPGKEFAWLGQQASRWSRRRSSVIRQRDQDGLREMIRTYAGRIFEEEVFDFIITGHMHIRDDWTCPRRKFRSINLGSWFEEPQVLRIEGPDRIVWLPV